MSDKVFVKLVRSRAGRPRSQRLVLDGLGLRKVNSSVIRENTPQVQGMIAKVAHLVVVEPANTGN